MIEHCIILILVKSGSQLILERCGETRVHFLVMFTSGAVGFGLRPAYYLSGALSCHGNVARALPRYLSTAVNTRYVPHQT